MGFRTLIVKSRVKLELRLNYLVVRGEVEKKVYLSEINTVIIQSTAVSMTAALLNELAKNNIKVIFCDEKCSPSAELMPYYGAHNTSKRCKIQIGWKKEVKDKVWQVLITRKISEQSRLLQIFGHTEEAEMLSRYADQVERGDRTNREGHAAKVYFNAILAEGTSRRDQNFVNGCLNYGYAVLLSAFNREVVAAGYLTQFGIWHDNEFNSFNLSCDLMEPFRPYVDYLALRMQEDDPEFKRKLADLLNYSVVIEGQKTTMDLAIRRFCTSVFRALAEDLPEEIPFVEQIEWKDES